MLTGVVVVVVAVVIAGAVVLDGEIVLGSVVVVATVVDCWLVVTAAGAEVAGKVVVVFVFFIHPPDNRANDTQTVKIATMDLLFSTLTSFNKCWSYAVSG